MNKEQAQHYIENNLNDGDVFKGFFKLLAHQKYCSSF